ncbi:hypothetical protein D3C87_1277440 [compost metagenome]
MRSTSASINCATVVALRVAACWALACSRISKKATMLRIAMTVRLLPRMTRISGRPVLPEAGGVRRSVMGLMSAGMTG